MQLKRSVSMRTPRGPNDFHASIGMTVKSHRFPVHTAKPFWKTACSGRWKLSNLPVRGLAEFLTGKLSNLKEDSDPREQLIKVAQKQNRPLILQQDL
ncbi:unnamed protein product [Euphydryas editha]|uniref:Uncharacterized protein n=1 Tax=Euphydryas editha TaxID=104508 RepID=A0AAU9UEA1_EUPED|nr:unnamed protein product [Euphydryas editha]